MARENLAFYWIRSTLKNPGKVPAGLQHRTAVQASRKITSARAPKRSGTLHETKAAMSYDANFPVIPKAEGRHSHWLLKSVPKNEKSLVSLVWGFTRVDNETQDPSTALGCTFALLGDDSARSITFAPIRVSGGA